jgi:proteasome lid subunit RPN8/RPN11
LNLLKSHYLDIINHSIQKLPNEACGLLAGKDDVVELVIFISNQYHSPTRFFMEPLELLNAFNWIDEHGMELMAMFHSHPNGPEHPSLTDLKEFFYPGIESMIVSPQGENWRLKSFRIEQAGYVEIPYQIRPDG